MKELVLSSSKENVLSKQQQLFNRLIKQIEDAKKTLEKHTKKLDSTLDKYAKKLVPLKTELQDKQFLMLQKLDMEVDILKVSIKIERQVSEIIVTILATMFRDIVPTEEQMALYDKWAELSYQEEEELQMAEQKKMMEVYIKNQTNFDIDLSTFDGSPEAMAKILQNLEDKIKEDEGSYKQHKSKPKLKQTEKQIEAEQRVLLADEIKSKTIRSIYISLVKLLHPDTETNEAVRLEKEEIMKKVTVAYNNNDLVTLLTIEVEWVYKNNNQLHQLKDDVLKIYNETLQEQLKSLALEKYQLSSHPKYAPIQKANPFGFNNAIINIEKEKRDCDNEIDLTKSIIEDLNKSPKNRFYKFNEIVNNLQRHYCHVEDEMDLSYLFR